MSQLESEENHATFAEGSIVSHYRIIRLLGKGTMGEVYLAQDLKLERQVALKFLPAWLSRDEQARSRLIEEARAASKLNHPNIMAIYSLEECGGRDFIVMEYVDGISLKELISKGGLGIEEISSYAVEIARGLEAAHSRQLVHGDIKSQNIMIDPNGRVKICDFGLARLANAVAEQGSKPTGGTLAYMSPEQTQGAGADHLSDIFSFGVVLYEMLTGALPFKGDYEAALIYSIANDSPSPLSEYRKDLPAHLQKIINKALEKDPRKRLQSAGEIVARLKTEESEKRASKTTRDKLAVAILYTGFIILVALISGLIILPRLWEHKAGGRKMVAVLPFENLGPEADRPFVRGISISIIANLSKIKALGVISWTSAQQYENSNKSIRQIGRELGADYIMEGAVMLDTSQAISRVRIDPRLIQVSDDTHLWAEIYERTFDSLPAIQAEIAESVATKINITLVESEKKSLGESPTENSEAYVYYLKGLSYYGRTWHEQDVRFAIMMYDEAIEEDPSFAMAYAALSRAHSAMYSDYYDRTRDRLALAKSAVDTALRLQPDLPEAHLALGIYYYSVLDFDRAMEQFRIVRRDRPDDSDLLSSIAGLLRRQGDFASALKDFIRAFTFDPRSQLKAFDIALTYSMMRQYSESEKFLNLSSSRAPDWPLPYIYKAWLYIFWQGDKTRARRVLEEAPRTVDFTRSEYNEYYWWLSRIIDQDYKATLSKISPEADSAEYYLAKAQIYRLNNIRPLVSACYDSARKILERQVEEQPYDPRFHSRLGLALAGLGLKEKAVSEGVKAAKMLPYDKDAYSAQFMVANLAEIYVMNGDYVAATDQIKLLLSRPGFTSIPYLKADPIWAPLLDYPPFRRLEKRGN